jgi:aldehyde dehydrogenase (NAD+)
MRDYTKFYIDGSWVDPPQPKNLNVVNPATEAVAGHISMGSAEDVDRAFRAASKAFASWSRTGREERIALFERVATEYGKRCADITQAITEEMGAPAVLAQRAQAGVAMGHLKATIELLKAFSFEEDRGTGWQGAHRGLRNDYSQEVAD